MKLLHVLAILTAMALAACSQERSRAVTETTAGGNHDYRQMIERARNKQSSQHALDGLQDGIRAFQTDIGRLPTNITELVLRHYVKSIPTLPPGQQFFYDPVHGNVTIGVAQNSGTPALPPEPALTNRPRLTR